MNFLGDFDSEGNLCCSECHYKFGSQLEYSLHRSAHQSDPVVSLVKLNDLSVGKLKGKSSKVNTGVSRRSRNIVSPLRISLKKQEGSVQFEVVKSKRRYSRDKPCTEVKPREPDEMSSTMRNRQVEESELYGWPDSNTSAKRKFPSGDPSTQGAEKLGVEQRHDREKKKKYSGKGKKVSQTASGGKSTGKKKSSGSCVCSSTEDLNTSEVGIPVPAAAEDASDVKQITVPESEIEKLRKTTILEKLSELGFSLVPISAVGTDVENKVTVKDDAVNESSEQTNSANASEIEISAPACNAEENEQSKVRSRNTEPYPFNIVEILNEKPHVDNWPGLANKQSKAVGVAFDAEQTLACQDQLAAVQKKHTQNYMQRERGIQVDMSCGGGGPVDPNHLVCTNSSGMPFACELDCSKNNRRCLVHWRPRSPDSDNRRPNDFHATCTVTHLEQQITRNALESGCRCTTERTEACILSARKPKEDSLQPVMIATENDGLVAQEDLSFSRQVYNNPSVEEPRQESTVTSDDAPYTNASVTRGAIQSYPLPHESRIRPEGLGGSHIQRHFDINAVEPTTPMEQLSQQVHRLHNNPPINAMPHVQAPQPYPLGLPPLPSHQATSFDRLRSLQPPLPPALYQGYGMFNQNFPIQDLHQFPSRYPLFPPSMAMMNFPNLVPQPVPRSRSTSRKSPAKASTTRTTARRQRRTEPAPENTLPFPFWSGPHPPNCNC